MGVATDSRFRMFIGAVEDNWQLYSNNSSDYIIGLPIGFGASSIVYAAKYQPPDGAPPIPCALKVLDLDRLPPSALRLLQNETQLMSLSKHPNVLRVRGSWVDGHKLYIAMRLMNAGSIADVMRYQWPGGLDEEVIRCILKQALQGLNYFHINGLIHRDVKAANLLIDDDGTVLLGDLGVAAFLWDSEGTQTGQSSKSRTVNFDIFPRHNHSNHQRGAAPASLQRPSILGKRKSFVGTPCWMAPEVINGKQYDASADIWSFGITAIELAQGRAPRSRLNPNKVLVMTVTDAPPQLERNAGVHRYSSAFADILLQMPFFRNAKKPSYLCSTILKGLPPLTQRQERRKQPSILTHGTIDSWDFASSLPASPTTSVYSHHRRPMNLLPQDSVFEMEDGSGGQDDTKVAENATSHEDDARIDGHSDAEAYAHGIRARHHRSSTSRSWHTHSRSGSHQSLHSHHSQHHSRSQSHEESRSTVHSIQQVMVQEVSSEESSKSDASQRSRARQDREGYGIPVASPPHRDTLDVPPLTAEPSSSPCPSSCSASVTTSSSSPLGPATPPPSSSVKSSAKSQTGKLWRRLAAKLDLELDKEKSEPGAQPPTPTSARKRSFGAVWGRTANMSADIVRTASRTMTNSKQT
ncbi:kinase-like domain-containing protein [Fomes fomentarius]|nr:kinase-like domain-containing protein [Fomes fomentarius]